MCAITNIFLNIFFLSKLSITRLWNHRIHLSLSFRKFYFSPFILLFGSFFCVLYDAKNVWWCFLLLMTTIQWLSYFRLRHYKILSIKHNSVLQKLYSITMKFIIIYMYEYSHNLQIRNLYKNKCNCIEFLKYLTQKKDLG